MNNDRDKSAWGSLEGKPETRTAAVDAARVQARGGKVTRRREGALKTLGPDLPLTAEVATLITDMMKSDQGVTKQETSV